MTGSSQPGDIDPNLNQTFSYDSRNRVSSWTNAGIPHAYGYDELGNLTNNAGTAQAFSDAARPHAIQSRGGGATMYSHDADGNVTSIVGGGSPRYFQFDSANHIICADTSQGGCALSRVHYDVDGRRVLDDDPINMKFTAFPNDTVSLDGGLAPGTRIEIWAFGERIAYKSSGDDFRIAGGFGGATWGLPPAGIGLVAALGLLGLLAWAHQRGALILVIQRPAYAGISAVLVVALVLGPIPGARVSKAGGGGDANFYWELTDPLGTGMVMLDETGARQVHRIYSPFGVEHAAVGNAQWLPRRFAGHVEDKDSGLLYMQARWMDAKSGTFLSVDPVVAEAGDPQSFNAYAYARNNPVSFADPTGQFWAELGAWLFGLSFSFELAVSSVTMGSIYGLSVDVHPIVRPPTGREPTPVPQAYPIGISNPLSGGLNLGGSPGPQSQREVSSDPTGHQINEYGEIEIRIVKWMQPDDEVDMGLFETAVRTPILRDLFRAADGLKETFIGISVAIGGILGLTAGNFALALASPALFLASRFGGGPTIGSAFAALNRGSVSAISQGGQFAGMGLQRAASGLTFDSSLRLVGLQGIPPPRHH